jgi:hypothetical protein
MFFDLLRTYQLVKGPSNQILPTSWVLSFRNREPHNTVLYSIGSRLQLQQHQSVSHLGYEHKGPTRLKIQSFSSTTTKCGCNSLVHVH